MTSLNYSSAIKDQLVTRVHQIALRAARRYGVGDLAEDVAQDVAVKFFEREYQSIHLEAYVSAAVSNHCVSLIRRESRRREREQRAYDECQWATTSYPAEMEWVEIDSIFEDLPVIQASRMRKLVLTDCTMSEIAADEAVTPSAVRQSISNAIENLRVLMDVPGPTASISDACTPGPTELSHTLTSCYADDLSLVRTEPLNEPELDLTELSLQQPTNPEKYFVVSLVLEPPSGPTTVAFVDAAPAGGCEIDPKELCVTTGARHRAKAIERSTIRGPPSRRRTPPGRRTSDEDLFVTAKLSRVGSRPLKERRRSISNSQTRNRSSILTLSSLHNRVVWHHPAGTTHKTLTMLVKAPIGSRSSDRSGPQSLALTGSTDRGKGTNRPVTPRAKPDQDQRH